MDLKETAVVVVSLLLMVVVLCGAAIASNYSCKSQWADSGMKVRWGLLEGCRVESKPGVWIPADRYRTID